MNELLSIDERQRAASFVFDKDRRRFAAGRGILRDILARYVGIHPADILFNVGSAGKPYLADQSGRSLQFNLSHSGNLALLAVTVGEEIGVDVEWVRSTVEVDQVAPIVFSPAEMAVLNGLVMPHKREAFFNGWTRKEAIVKALGAGLGYPVRQLTVAIAPDEPVRLIQAQEEALNGSRWTLAALSPGPGYVAALAHRGPPRGIKTLTWTDRLQSP
jgi:4'-phosphopantetheinyl transferase